MPALFPERKHRTPSVDIFMEYAIFPMPYQEACFLGAKLKKLKIALVETSSPSTHVYSRTYLPRVGIPTLGAIMKNLGHDCDLWFQSMPGFDENQLRNYDIVGIGSLSSTITEAYRLADAAMRNGQTVVMGGPHVSFMPEEALTHCNYVVIGEGESTFASLVTAISKEEPAKNIPGLAIKNGDGKAAFTGPGVPADYANLPTPDFNLSPQVRSGLIPPIISTSRGCPHDCKFCSVTAMFGRKYRFKSNKQIISELRPLLDRSVCFGDDNFCANPTRAKSLLKEMIDQKAIPLRWAGEMTVGAAADEELLDLMQKTRCRIMFVGIESIKPETLKDFGKVHDVQSIGRCVENMHKRNIGIHGMFVVGADDDEKTANDIVDYAIEKDIDTIQICALTPFPGTATHVELKDRILHTDWQYYDGMHVVFKPNKCSAYDLQKSIVEGMIRFYHPKRLLGSYRIGRGWRLKYRFGGYYLMKKWIKENKNYMERLK